MQAALFTPYKIACALALLCGFSMGARADEVLFEDTFDADQPAAGWHWLREHDGFWRMKEGGLEIRVEPGDAASVKNALLRKAPDRKQGPFAIEVTVHNQSVPTVLYEQAGITWYLDGKPKFKLVKELVHGELMTIPGRKPMTAPKVRLRWIVDGESWTAQYQPNAEGPFLETARGKLPPPGTAEEISIQCYHGPTDVEHWIRFDDFRIVRLEKAP